MKHRLPRKLKKAYRLTKKDIYGMLIALDKWYETNSNNEELCSLMGKRTPPPMHDGA